MARGSAQSPPLPLRQNTPDAFREQLREGHYNELRVALWFMLEGWHANIRFCQGRYDIALWRPDRPVRHVEVKWDKRAQDSGNLYFEVENTRQGSPSGIMATDADGWCHVLGQGDQGLLIKVAALREFLTRGGFRSVNTRGSDSNSRGLLVPMERALACPHFRRVRLPTVEEYFGEVFRRGERPG